MVKKTKAHRIDATDQLGGNSQKEKQGMRGDKDKITSSNVKAINKGSTAETRFAIRGH